ncbi:GNAT family N-acetyltransferase [Halalkalibacter hemicellulosilyticus]|uniref:Ribosomal-protein-alanine acetyltransferase n=1 Tax=Halalkalibacter hemicellulosilyticusJCM 9152 TaxID=1236971 RepID=W4QBQ0_9BACI|nr:GNAT family N-acetyltransferase [Halalkalibacter hemicellulosilyticus]GAE29387.1 ribosomal-protein-alanine acetyltransferase [Halalkalibacter hemicellulosilyticusJCM 9152]
MEALKTERLILREWKETDSQDLYEYAKSELVGPNAGWKPHHNEEESKEIIKMFIRSSDTYAVVLKAENKVIGSIGLHDRKPDDSLVELKQKEIGYVLHPEYWGRGIIPEAVNRVITYGFNKLNLDLIWCGHFNFNQNSKRVSEKCGFTYRFQKKEKLKLLGNKDVTTLYYCMFKSNYIEDNESFNKY